MTASNNGIPEDSSAILALRSAKHTASAPDDAVDAARHNVNVAKAQLRADLSRVSSAGETAARRVWSSARPALIIGGAAVGAFLVYRLVASSRRAPPAPLIRIVLAGHDRHSPQPQRAPWLNVVRSVGLSLGTALLRSWLARVSASGESDDKLVAFESNVAEQPHAL